MTKNIFLFGLTTEQVNQRKRDGYRPHEIYLHNSELKRIIDQVTSGFADGVPYSSLSNRLLFGEGGSQADEYMLLADFDSYCDAHQRALAAYGDRRLWNQMSLINIARSGIFAADRSIAEYADNIWHVPHR